MLKTVRVSISTKEDNSTPEHQRVRIGILLNGSQDNFNHVRKVLTRNYFFHENEQIVNFDDAIDYDELNNQKTKSHFLSGSSKDSLKVTVVMTPLNDFSSLDVS